MLNTQFPTEKKAIQYMFRTLKQLCNGSVDWRGNGDRKDSQFTQIWKLKQKRQVEDRVFGSFAESGNEKEGVILTNTLNA